MIPTSKLQDSYTDAMREHEGMAVLGAHELVQAYRRISVPKPEPFRGLRPPPGGCAAPEEIAEIMGAARAKIAASRRERDARTRATDGFQRIDAALPDALPAEPVTVNGFEQWDDDGDIPF